MKKDSYGENRDGGAVDRMSARARILSLNGKSRVSVSNMDKGNY